MSRKHQSKPMLYVCLLTAISIVLLTSAYFFHGGSLADQSRDRLPVGSLATYIPSLNPPIEPPTRGLRWIRPAYIIGIACGIRDDDELPLEHQPIFETLLASAFFSLEASYTYRFYFTFDSNDRLWDNTTSRELVDAVVTKHRASSGILMSSHWIRCEDCRGAPSKAHSIAVITAYSEGCHYVFRVNDDTQMPTQGQWTTRFILDLLHRDMPNVGVVGPDFPFNVFTPILSHDFTHWTHVAIHGYHYPPELPNWSADDWITYVYDQFNMTHKLTDVVIEHKTRKIRYDPSDTERRQAALTETLNIGAARIMNWADRHHHVVLHKGNKVYTTP